MRTLGPIDTRDIRTIRTSVVCDFLVRCSEYVAALPLNALDYYKNTCDVCVNESEELQRILKRGKARGL